MADVFTYFEDLHKRSRIPLLYEYSNFAYRGLYIGNDKPSIF